MTLTLIYFAALRDLAGLSEEEVSWPTPGCSVDALVKDLLKHRPELIMQGVRVAVNEEFVELDALLKPDDVVAFIPPVSGG